MAGLISPRTGRGLRCSMAKDSSFVIPLFPLNIVLLPGERIQLHIFEDRYKEMINSSIDNDTPFGIILRTKSFNPSVGCAAKVLKVENEYYTGELDIVIEGIDRFNVLERYKLDDLWHGDITLIGSDPLSPNEDHSILTSVQEKYIQVLMLSGDDDFSDDLDRKMSYEFSSKILLPLSIKQVLIETDDETRRLEILDNLFEKVIDKLGHDEIPQVKD